MNWIRIYFSFLCFGLKKAKNDDFGQKKNMVKSSYRGQHSKSYGKFHMVAQMNKTIFLFLTLLGWFIGKKAMAKANANVIFFFWKEILQLHTQCKFRVYNSYCSDFIDIVVKNDHLKGIKIAKVLDNPLTTRPHGLKFSVHPHLKTHLNFI